MRLYPLLRPLLFRLPPEEAHTLTLRLLRLTGKFPPALLALRKAFSAPAAPVEAFGLRFPNPLGLAAGYDKDGTAIHGLAALGFGHLEIGTVTPRPQAGNPKPRVFRLPEKRAIINRMGFPSAGAAVVARNLQKGGRPPNVILGVNIGKNKDTPNEEAVQDYLTLLEAFLGLADYLTVNVSSPNTVGLRALQHRAMLEDLLGRLYERRAQSFSGTVHLPFGPTIPGDEIPILVKLSPDLTPAQLESALEAVVRSRMDGVILTNTTVSRPVSHPLAAERGGLSGAPLRELSETALRRALRLLDGALPVVSVGGVMTPEDVQRRLDMGAALVQVYTGLVYSGPSLPRDALRGLTAARTRSATRPRRAG